MLPERRSQCNIPTLYACWVAGRYIIIRISSSLRNKMERVEMYTEATDIEVPSHSSGIETRKGTDKLNEKGAGFTTDAITCNTIMIVLDACRATGKRNLSCFLNMNQWIEPVSWIKTHRFSSCSFAGRSPVRSEYQRFKYLANGARGIPFRMGLHLGYWLWLRMKFTHGLVHTDGQNVGKK